MERIEMHNSGEKECAAIALDGLLSEEAGYSDGSIKKPISMKKESSRNGRHDLSPNNVLEKLKVEWKTLCDTKVDFDAPQTFPGILELPLSQGRRIEKMYVSEEERKSKGVLFWVNNHPYASWRLLIMQLDKHSVSNQIHQYAEKVTDHSFTHQNISMVTATIKDLHKLADCLRVPSTKRREIRETTSTSAEYREGLINYFIQYSPYATWSDLCGKLYYNEHPEAVAAARKFIKRTPETTLNLPNLSTLLERVSHNYWDDIGLWMNVLSSKLDEIRRRHLCDDQYCSRACWELYLKEHPSPSWQLVAYALYMRDHLEELEVVQKKYLKVPNVQPSDLHVIHKLPTSAEVSWTPIPKEQNSFITGYTVQVVEPVSGSTRYVLIEGADATFAEIANLNPFTLYTFKVSANIKAEPGPAASISSQTPEAAPSACPGLLTVNHSLPTTAKLSWTPLPKEKQNGVIIGYTVQIVRPDSSSARDVIIETADATSTEISNLNPSTKYTFKISAKTKAGSGPAASISSQTPEGVPCGSPGGITVDHRLPTTATLSWTPLPEEEQNGVITGYAIQVVGHDSNSTRDVVVEGANATSIEIPNLSPFTLYTFKIGANTKAGSGPVASISSRTPEGAPSVSPEGITVNHRLPSTAKVSWTPLPKEKQNGVITGYTVQAMGPDSSSTREILVEGADATSTEISNLNPFTLYTFKVSAKTKVGSGPAATKQSKTPEGVPSGSPGELTVNHRLPTTAKLSWTPLPEKERNGVVTGYTVQVMGPDQSTLYNQVVSEDVISIEIPNLNPSTLYTFKVSAKTKAGSGPEGSVLSKTPNGGQRYEIPMSRAVLVTACFVLILSVAITAIFRRSR